jgi:hypothetical protein
MTAVTSRRLALYFVLRSGPLCLCAMSDEMSQHPTWILPPQKDSGDWGLSRA